METPSHKETEVAAGRDEALAVERALLEIARTALSRGQPEAAIDALRHHAEQYPHGRLEEEREGLWVIALAQADLLPEARRRAEGFRRRYPGSLLLPAIEQSLPKNR
jgi:hypothetical protein